MAVFPKFTCLFHTTYTHYLPMNQWKYRIDSYRFEVYQAIYWVLYSALTFLNNSFLAEPFRWWEVWLTIAFVMAFVYSIVYVFFRIRKPLVVMLVILVGMFLAYAFLFYVVAFIWQPRIGHRFTGTASAVALGAYLFTMFLYWYHSMVEAGLLASIYRIRDEERQKRLLMEENHRTQLQFLMAQMEPHEQYNMLNIPYAMAIKAGENEISIALEELKAYTRYVQEKAMNMRGEVALEDELAHCRCILAINLRRFDEVYCDLDVPIDHGDWQVPVLSISALLQNAFKYGISWDSRTPISLRMECNERHLAMVIKNKVNPYKSEQQRAGSGNDNIRQRLKLMYADQAHLLTQQTEGGWYEATITLNK